MLILNELLLFVAEPSIRHPLSSVARLACPTMSEPTPLRCVIAEDNEMNRLTLAHLVDLTPGLVLVASFADGLATLAYLQSHPPVDLLLLDIEMPHLTGLELIRVLPQPLPAIVLVTSHTNFAVQAFELPVTDFLVKPVEYPRFLQAVQSLSIDAADAKEIAKIRAITERVCESDTHRRIVALVGGERPEGRQRSRFLRLCFGGVHGLLKH